MKDLTDPSKLIGERRPDGNITMEDVKSAFRRGLTTLTMHLFEFFVTYFRVSVLSQE